MEIKENGQNIVKRLNAIINLLIDLVNQGEARPQMFIVKKLKLLGFENKEIASILGRDSTQIAKLFYETKRKNKKKGDR